MRVFVHIVGVVIKYLDTGILRWSISPGLWMPIVGEGIRVYFLHLLVTTRGVGVECGQCSRLHNITKLIQSKADPETYTVVSRS